MNVSLNTRPEKRELRSFGITMAVMIAAVFGLVLPWLFEKPWPSWPWAVALILLLWAAAAPRTLRMVYVAWMAFGLAMSKVTTPLIMGAVFILVVFPVGLVLRLFRPDAMRRRFEPEVDSYRETSDSPTPDHFARPF